ncbi:MAG: hypothetical protein JXA25_03295 [Anaerolineales bacterium]|nr:hypothetical protein [Anaerolineales bacterium]
MITYFRYKDRHRLFRKEQTKLRDIYRKCLDEIEKECRFAIIKQKEALDYNFPSNDQISHWVLMNEGRIWERRKSDPDFLELRLGLGRRRTSFEIKSPRIEFPELAPPGSMRARDLVERYAWVDQVPITVALTGVPMLAVAGPMELRGAFIRSLLCQLAGLHAPADLSIAAIYQHRTANQWEWIKWLPHTGALLDNLPRIAYDNETGAALLSQLLEKLRENKDHPYMLLVVEDAECLRESELFRVLLSGEKDLKVLVFFLSAHPSHIPAGFNAVVEILSDQQAEYKSGASAPPVIFRQDQLDLEKADFISRKLASLKNYDVSQQSDLPESVRLLDLMDLNLDTLDLKTRWQRLLTDPPQLEAIAGMRAGKRPLLLNLKQSAAGPHGLIAGTTGSGKSEFLLSLLTGLALNHHPHQVQFLLIDYKGGTAMSVLRRLPHTIGLVTDLDGRQTIRTLQMLSGEMQRRERMLTDACVADIDKYHQAGLKKPFPYLFIVIDEFAELRDRFRYDLGQVMDQFISVAQKGRALGVHLVIAMQKPEGVVNDRIRANMKFRICLRVERAEDSRNVLGTADAYLLPANPPGRAYYRVGNFENYEQFQVARIAGVHQVGATSSAVDPDLSVYEICPDGSRVVLIQDTRLNQGAAETTGKHSTEAEVLVQMAEKAAVEMGLQKLPGPWIEPLPERIGLGSLVEQFFRKDMKEWNWEQKSKATPVGLVDDPVNQRQFLYEVELSSGNMLIVGSPGSGRTTFLQTAVYSLAYVYPPDELHVHIIDFSGHKLLASFGDFPHIGGIYQAADEERVLKLLRFLTDVLNRRKQQFLERKVVGLSAYNNQCPAEEREARLLIVINNYIKFREQYPEDLSEWMHLIREGTAYGISFILTADRPLMGREMELIKKRVVLSLLEKSHYGILLGSKLNTKKMLDIPGRGYISGKDPLEVQIASPADGGEEHWIGWLNQIGTKMAESWRGTLPHDIKALPEKLGLWDLMKQYPEATDEGTIGGKILLGLDEQHLLPVWFEPDKSPQRFLISGPPSSGKSAALGTILSSITSTIPAGMVDVLVLSHQRGIKAVPFLQKPEIKWLDSSAGEWFEEAGRFLENVAKKKMEPLESRGLFLLIIDDLQLVSADMEARFGSLLDFCLEPEISPNFWIFASLPQSALQSPDRMIRRFRTSMGGIWLVSTDYSEALKVGVHIPKRMRGRDLPPGRGVYYDPSGQKVIQVAFPGEHEMKDHQSRQH